MQSLIIPVVLLLLLGISGVYSTGKKFRKEFKSRGKSWASVCASMARGEGVVVVDLLWGPQQGLGRPVIWWLPAAPGIGVGLEPMLRGEVGSAMLVECPRRMRSEAALRNEFGAARVMVHNWAIGSGLLNQEATQV